jgi:hypothetical protein
VKAISFDCGVEGSTDEAVLRNIAKHIGIDIGRVFGLRGKPLLIERVNSYNQAASYYPWIVIVDLDDKPFECAPIAISTWLANPSQFMCFRVVVHEIESWLMADHERFSLFFNVDKRSLPFRPDEVLKPKEKLIEIVRKSNSRYIREQMLPRKDSFFGVGPGYSSLLQDFVNTTDRKITWRPSIASMNSDSLKRCIEAMQELSKIISRVP